jgi:hypothetical protein
MSDGESYWNYRVVKKGEMYGIHECHYTGNGDIEYVTENAVAVDAESREGVKWCLRMMESNWILPVVDFETLEEI